MHYIGDDGVADDDSKDMQLPFKKSDRAPLLEVYGSVGPSVFIQTDHPPADVSYSLFKGRFFPYPCQGDLLKPPQVYFLFSVS
jgi:hypothetical protein